MLPKTGELEEADSMGKSSPNLFPPCERRSLAGHGEPRRTHLAEGGALPIRGADRGGLGKAPGGGRHTDFQGLLAPADLASESWQVERSNQKRKPSSGPVR